MRGAARKIALAVGQGLGLARAGIPAPVAALAPSRARGQRPALPPGRPAFLPRSQLPPGLVIAAGLVIAVGPGCTSPGDFCFSDSDCPAPLRCNARPGARGVCTYPLATPDARPRADLRRDLGLTPADGHLPDALPDGPPPDGADDLTPGDLPPGDINAGDAPPADLGPGDLTTGDIATDDSATDGMKTDMA